MSQHKAIPFSITLDEIDNLLFEVLVAEFKAMYPTDHRMALRAGMHVADKVMVNFEPYATRAAKAAGRAQAAQATPQATQGAPAPQTQPTAPAAPAARTNTPITPRKRRTKAEIEAEVIAKHAAKMAAATAGGQGVGSTTQQPQPMGQVYAPAENLFAAPPQAQVAPYQPPPVPQAPQQAATPALLPQAPQQAAAPVVDNFAALAQAAAAGQVPQFAPPAATGPVPTPPPTFG